MIGNKNDTILLRAKIRLKTTEEGGRIHGIKTNYRPNHVFEIKDNGKFFQTYIGEIQFEHEDFIELGETKEVRVVFLQTFEIEKYLSIGRKWFIYEGGKYVGDAEIIDM